MMFRFVRPPAPWSRPAFLAAFLLLSAGRAEAAFFLRADNASIHFGPADPGLETAPQVVTLNAQSDAGASWFIKMRAAPLGHTEGDTIPSSAFLYWFGSDHPGTEAPPFPSTAPVPESDETIYAGGVEECAEAPCSFSLGFKVVIPRVQRAGAYSTSLVFTLMDSR
jgi:hypothetical protein